MTTNLVRCECYNPNCEWHSGLAVPYSYCPSCGYVVEPIDEFTYIESEERELGHDQR